MLDALWDRKIKGLLSDKSLQYVENAYFCCRPIQTAHQIREDNTSEFQKEIKTLIFEKLNESTAEDVTNKLIKLFGSKHHEENLQYLFETILKFAQQGTYTDLDNIWYVVSCFTKGNLSQMRDKMIKDLIVAVQKDYSNEIDDASVNFIDIKFIKL